MNTDKTSNPSRDNPLFQIDRWSAFVLEESDLPQLQRLFEENPVYFETVSGQPPTADEAEQEFYEMPPPDMAFVEKWVVGFTDRDQGSGELVGMAIVIADLLTTGVWHTGLFLVATTLHGTGTAATLYEGMETWMRGQGAQWGRLGVVLGHRRAENFWKKMGYSQVRQRNGIVMGDHTNTVRVLLKPFAGGSLVDYLALVARDRPEKA